MKRPDSLAPITVLGHIKGRHYEYLKFFYIFYFDNDSLLIHKTLQSNSISFVFGKAPSPGGIHLKFVI